LLSRSQASLRDMFEVSTPELDLLCRLLTEPVDTEPAAAYGARLTGAGFGGSVLALLRRNGTARPDAGPSPLERALAAYTRATGLKPTLHCVDPDCGALLKLPRRRPHQLGAWLGYYDYML
jgi:galactokinase